MKLNCSTSSLEAIFSSNFVGKQTSTSFSMTSRFDSFSCFSLQMKKLYEYYSGNETYLRTEVQQFLDRKCHNSAKIILLFEICVENFVEISKLSFMIRGSSRLMTMSPLFPCSKPCSTGTHIGTVEGST